MKHSPASLLTPKSPAAALASTVVFLILIPSASAYIRLRCNSNYDGIVGEPALFAVPINASGICGSLHAADPLEACSALSTNFSSPGLNDSNTGNRFVLIKRGKCSFDRKVRVSQAAGFRAAIIFDNEQSKYLCSMKGNPEGIHIHAVFVSMGSGPTLQEYADGHGECCMGPLAEENFESMLVMSFIAVVALISAIVVIAYARYWLIPRIVARRRRNSYLDRSQVEYYSALHIQARPFEQESRSQNLCHLSRRISRWAENSASSLSSRFPLSMCGFMADKLGNILPNLQIPAATNTMICASSPQFISFFFRFAPNRGLITPNMVFFEKNMISFV
ncbi:hypothetical protein KSP40_PGU016152 [Platanthera guangdongensis]|uniref:PA domain-containing protein n=1 Tax=Platanthera guangdongensis TaxID=2320717 RepID=A0ABR2MZ08_9ASPA